jgi:two-component system OmpR family sensor kinase/two-component system sensor histidine kinase BaeS
MMGRGMMGGMMGGRLVLADKDGTVVADSAGLAAGQKLFSSDVANGIPIQVKGQQVGTLVVDSEMMGGLRFSPLEEEFLQRVNRSVVLAGLIAGVIALAIGFILFRQITAPLRDLTLAARRIAGGNLSQRVEIRSQDEIGELSHAFNVMAESLARAENSRRTMVAGIAHELRTPLSVVQGNLEALLDGVFPPTPENIAAIHQETLLLSRLVDDLRELALAEAGQLKIEKQPTDLADLIQRTVLNFRAEATDRGIELGTELASDLPQVPVDPHRLEQVLRNLLANALRYTPAGGRVVVAASSPHSPQSWGARGAVVVSVADTGVGIPADDLPHVFERFWRGDRSRSRTGGGAGLGLAIAKELVEAHGGTIGVESREGQGAVFTIRLPAG